MMKIDYAAPTLSDDDVAYLQIAAIKLSRENSVSGKLPFHTPSGLAVSYLVRCNPYGRIITFTSKRANGAPLYLALASGAY